jgi:GNAT superfamily N-acetyltransferase
MPAADSVFFPCTVSTGDLSLCIRSVTPGDRERLREGIASISPETAYRRFFTPRFTPDEEDLDYLTDVDGEDHLALGALDCRDPERRGVGVARCVRLEDAPTVAEMAVVVTDAYQNRGIGSLLLAGLSRCADRHGIERFQGYVLVENEPFFNYLVSLGARVVAVHDAVAELEIPVHASAGPLPDGASARARWAWRTLEHAEAGTCCD